ncbi:hypothetical protein ADL19_12355 [Streptomyces purpurogeneiscleroticus]|nr:hypothetical protein ADL19_12355 [Streptomyces purpurogeneiscleroticus]
MATVSWMGQRLRPTFLTHEDAEAWGREQTIRMIRGQELQAPADAKGRAAGRVPRTLQELYEHVRDTHWLVSGPGGGAKKSWPKIKVQVEQALTALGKNTSLSKLSVPYVEGKLRDMERDRGNCGRTTNRRMAYLGLMFKEAARVGAIERPIVMKKAPEVTEGRTFRITPDLERDMLLWAVAKGNVPFYDFLVLSIYLGQRANETLRLRVSESFAHPQDGYCDGVECALFPRGTAENKSTVMRAVPLRPIVAEVVKRHRAAAGSDARILEDVTHHMANHWFREMRAQLLLDRHPEIVRQKRDGLAVGQDFCIHIMRSEFCSRLGDEGYRVAEIAEYSGHTTLRTCERYTKPHKLAHRAKLAREGNLEPGLPGGEVPDFAPTQPLQVGKKGSLRLVEKPQVAAPAISPATAIKLFEALRDAGHGELLQSLVAGLEKKQA